ncbi:MAG TPA: DUF262 domain-containing protein [Rhodanobacter sp.]
MTLASQIDARRKEIKTDGYPMSISEWMSMYEKKELDIHPEFQRFYRWSESQKSSLIESILLGIPLPPIFVSQRSDGVWDVVDGLQRLSTIFQFAGILNDELGLPVDPLVLQGTEYLPKLEGVKWGGEQPKGNELPSDLRLLIKRSKISASIILKESDESAKYDLFQRLNTGGSELSPQEVRNCLLVMLNKNMFDWLRDLIVDEYFIESTALSDRPLEEAYDMELALRFIIFSQIDEADVKSIGDVGDFLTKKMRKIATTKNFGLTKNKKLFDKTFKIINGALGESAFKRYNKKKGRHEGGFLLSLYEVVALGVAYNIANNTLVDESKIAELAQSIWDDPNFTQWASSGVTASRRLPRLLPLGRKLFQK